MQCSSMHAGLSLNEAINLYCLLEDFLDTSAQMMWILFFNIPLITAVNMYIDVLGFFFLF